MFRLSWNLPGPGLEFKWERLGCKIDEDVGADGIVGIRVVG